MYKGYLINGEQEDLIHALGPSNARFAKAKITKSLNLIDKFEFTLLPNSPAWNNLDPGKTIIEVRDGQTIVFRGSVLDVTPTMDATGVITKQVVAQGELSYLQDSYQPFREVNNTTPAQFFSQLIATHNAQVSQDKQFTVGNVTVTNSTDNVYRYLSYQDTFSAINEKLLNSLGGFLSIRYQNGVRYLDYLDDSGTNSTMPISVHENLASVSAAIKTADVYTRLVPLGATQSRPGKESLTAQPKLTIASVNNGVDYLINHTLENVFGVRYATHEWPDVTQATNLLAKGRQLLDSQRIIETISLTAYDLSLINQRYERFQLGNKYRLLNPLIGLNAWYPLSSVSIDLIEPQTSSITLGDRKLTLTQYNQLQADAEKANDDLINQVFGAQSMIDQLQGQINNNQSLTDDQLNAVRNELDEIRKQLAGYLEGSIIDVSEHQGVIDWNKVKQSGVVLAIIRVQYGGVLVDDYYGANIAGAQAAGLRYAVYGYGLYVSEDEATEEAQNLYNRTQAAVGSGAQPAFYMIDLESDVQNVRESTIAWNEAMSALGVGQNKQVAYIANHKYQEYDVDVDRFGSIVIPAYGSEPSWPYDLHQYSSTGNVNGITGNVDMNGSPSQRFKDNYLRKDF